MSMPAKIIEHNGQSKTVTEWATALKITPAGLHYRIRCGWPLDEALALPRTSRGGRGAIDRANLDLIERKHDRKHKANVNRMRNEFTKLVVTLDGALRLFRDRLEALDNHTPGVGRKPRKVAADRSFPTAQDTV